MVSLLPRMSVVLIRLSTTDLETSHGENVRNVTFIYYIIQCLWDKLTLFGIGISAMQTNCHKQHKLFIFSTRAFSCWDKNCLLKQLSHYLVFNYPVGTVLKVVIFQALSCVLTLLSAAAHHCRGRAVLSMTSLGFVM